MQTLTGEPTCDECVGSVQAVAGLIGSEEKIAEVIAFLDVRSFLVSTTAFNIIEHNFLNIFSVKFSLIHFIRVMVSVAPAPTQPPV